VPVVFALVVVVVVVAAVVARRRLLVRVAGVLGAVARVRHEVQRSQPGPAGPDEGRGDEGEEYAGERAHGDGRV
jgi:hypothetical protein